MGAGGSKPDKESQVSTFETILDSYETLEDVQGALRQAGLESSHLILGLDFTKSNEWTGVNSFGGQCLHAVNVEINPYQEAISIIARTLASFDDDHLIPCYGFGDATTGDTGVFSFYQNDVQAHGLDSVLQRYKQMAPFVQLAGPTSFAPLIKQAMKVVVDSGNKYHILVIVADGQVTPTCLKDTINAIVAASHLPLSIIMVGVGDGPWETMQVFDDQLPVRKFDNFQFVNFHEVKAQAAVYSEMKKREAHFALHALMEIPLQYRTIVKLGLLQSSKSKGHLKGMEPNLMPPPPAVMQADMMAMAGTMNPSAPPQM
ncbi:hypothetical protein BSKO_01514 [Bryopsis sp. KO-2023]|nr:hypothetical protein BSKO_01514 [Bryopsis sp. KO-2023]